MTSEVVFHVHVSTGDENSVHDLLKDSPLGY